MNYSILDLNIVICLERYLYLPKRFKKSSTNNYELKNINQQKRTVQQLGH